MRSAQIMHGDCIEELAKLPADSVDLICTDPPYGIGFLGHAWDTFTPAYQRKRLMQERASHRKRGARGMVHQGATIAGTYDYSSTAHHAFQAFIRSVSVQCLRVLKPGGMMFVTMTPRQDSLSRVIVGMEEAGFNVGFTSLYWTFSSGFPKAMNIGKAVDKRKGARRRVAVSREATALEGSYGGFQPKPAVEVIIVAMKPLSEKSYLDQAIKDRKGITWLDDGRIPLEPGYTPPKRGEALRAGERDGWLCLDKTNFSLAAANSRGRFPANLLVGDSVLGEYSKFFSLDTWAREKLPFLLVPKASKREKNLVTRPGATPFTPYASKAHKVSGNTHPTVKPLKLMAYLIALGSRPGDTVLDPFLGSGTTAIAATLLGRRAIGIEREAAYIAIARRRLSAARR